MDSSSLSYHASGAQHVPTHPNSLNNGPLMMAHHQQQIPASHALHEPHMKTFVGLQPLDSCGCCLEISLLTGCKIILVLDFLSLLYSGYIYVKFATESPSNLLGIITCLTGVASVVCGVKAVSKLDPGIARWYYRWNLVSFILSLINWGLFWYSMLRFFSDWPSEFMTPILGNCIIGTLVSFYFLYVEFSFYAQLEAGHVDLLVHGPALHRLQSRNMMMPTPNHVVNHQHLPTSTVIQGVQMHQMNLPDPSSAMVHSTSYEPPQYQHTSIQVPTQHQLQGFQHNPSYVVHQQQQISAGSHPNFYPSM